MALKSFAFLVPHMLFRPQDGSGCARCGLHKDGGGAWTGSAAFREQRALCGVQEEAKGLKHLAVE